MSRSRLPVCDRCGRALEQLGDAIVVLRFDRDELLVEAGLHHRACASAAVPADGDRDELLEVAEACRPKVIVHLTELARISDAASITRLLRKAGRLGPKGAA